MHPSIARSVLCAAPIRRCQPANGFCRAPAALLLCPIGKVVFRCESELDPVGHQVRPCLWATCSAVLVAPPLATAASDACNSAENSWRNSRSSSGSSTSSEATASAGLRPASATLTVFPPSLATKHFQAGLSEAVDSSTAASSPDETKRTRCPSRLTRTSGGSSIANWDGRTSVVPSDIEHRVVAIGDYAIRSCARPLYEGADYNTPFGDRHDCFMPLSSLVGRRVNCSGALYQGVQALGARHLPHARRTSRRSWRRAARPTAWASCPTSHSPTAC